MDIIITFFKENYITIIVIIIIVLIILLLITITGYNLNTPKPNLKLIQEVTVETFTNQPASMADTPDNLEKIKLSSADNFCASYLGKASELELACNDLTESNCADTSCCVYSHGKCVAGGVNGPTYLTDKEGKLITRDSYYYQGKFYGK